MTRKKVCEMFDLFSRVVVRDKEDLFYYEPSVRIIDNCGGYELELHPALLMWGHKIVCLCAMADSLCLSVECRFYNGSIIIR